MTVQPDLFSPWSDSTARQPELFGEGWEAELGLSCAICGRPLVRTGSGYAACPGGHGRLMEVAPVFETPGGFFDTLED